LKKGICQVCGYRDAWTTDEKGYLWCEKCANDPDKNQKNKELLISIAHKVYKKELREERKPYLKATLPLRKELRKLNATTRIEKSRIQNLILC